MLNTKAGGVKVSLYSDNNGLPDRRLAWLEPIGGLRDGTVQFQANQVMGEAPLLLPDTPYHIHFAVEGAGAVLDVAGTNNVGTRGGFRLDNGSLSYIGRSLFNEAYWGYCVADIAKLPPQLADLIDRNHVCENIIGEYGDTYRPKRHPEEGWSWYASPSASAPRFQGHLWLEPDG